MVAEQFGSQQDFAELVTPLTTRMLGLYRVEVFGPPRKFFYQMRMPGAIVETSGVLAGENRVEWSFEAVQAYPFGYLMHGRSLAPNNAAQHDMLGSEPLSTRRDMLAFVEAYNSNFMVGEAIRHCLKRKSTAPIYEARDRTAGEGGSTRPYETIIRVLKLPANPPPDATSF